MTRTEELLALAEAATPCPWVVEEGSLVNRECDDDDKWCIAEVYHSDNMKFISAANPETIKQLCLRMQKLEALVRLQHEVLLTCKTGGYKDIDGDWQPRLSFDEVMKDNAIAAFNKFEGVE